MPMLRSRSGASAAVDSVTFCDTADPLLVQAHDGRHACVSHRRLDQPQHRRTPATGSPASTTGIESVRVVDAHVDVADVAECQQLHLLPAQQLACERLPDFTILSTPASGARTARVDSLPNHSPALPTIVEHTHRAAPVSGALQNSRRRGAITWGAAPGPTLRKRNRVRTHVPVAGLARPGQEHRRQVRTPGEYAGRMIDTTTIRVSRQTHNRLSRLAQRRHESIDQTVDRALRALRQVSMGYELNPELTDDERGWLDAELR